MVCHRFCPQALAQALKVNKTVTDINLDGNNIGKEGAKAFCLAHGVCGSRPRNGENKMESSGEPVVFETRETLVTLVLLDRCRACASFPKESVKWDGNKMEVRGAVALPALQTPVFVDFVLTLLVRNDVPLNIFLFPCI